MMTCIFLYSGFDADGNEVSMKELYGEEGKNDSADSAPDENEEILAMLSQKRRYKIRNDFSFHRDL